MSDPPASVLAGRVHDDKAEGSEQRRGSRFSPRRGGGEADAAGRQECPERVHHRGALLGLDESEDDEDHHDGIRGCPRARAAPAPKAARHLRFIELVALQWAMCAKTKHFWLALILRS